MSLANTTVLTLDKDYSSLLTREPSEHTISTKESPKAEKLKKEFSVASLMSKTVRSSMTPDMANICESYLGTKLTAKFRGLAKLAEGKSGYRPFYLSKYGKKLKGFDFNNKSPYRRVFKAKYYVKSGSRKGQVILHFPSFIPTKDMKSPEGATNFKISARMIALSDYGFDTLAKSYRQINQEYHGQYASYDSGMLPILKMPMDPITTQLSLDQKELPENTSLFLLMSVSFYSYQNGKFKHYSKESCMHLEQVF